jgi:hypothetical protein
MTTTDLERVAQPRPITLAASSEATAIEQARSVAEVAAAVRVAQDNPRDEAKAMERMRQACSQRSLADRAFYSLPRAGGRVEGSTVHLAREIARCWGNVDYGIRELRRDDTAGQSEMQAWAWDQENNVRSTRSFIVPHERMARKERQKLTDLGDIANNNNSVAARAVRETIFTILPVWFRDAARPPPPRRFRTAAARASPNRSPTPSSTTPRRSTSPPPSSRTASNGPATSGPPPTSGSSAPSPAR